MDKKAMYKLNYGVFVLTAKEGDKDNGCIINTAIQAASMPNQMSICVNKSNFTHDMIMRTGVFTVSVISQKATFDLFKHFGFQTGREVNKFADFTSCVRGENGIYYVTEGTNAYISVKVDKIEDLGSHTMFIGEITDMKVLSDDASATYDYYMNYIKPKPQEVGKTEDGQTIWRCTICGYEYVGEELPKDFICPLCKHPVSDFEKVIKKTEDKKISNKYAGTKTEKNLWKANMKFYVCETCGNIVGMIKESGVQMMCCGQKMKELIPGSSDGAAEKHVPIFKVEGNKVTVTVGSVEHPMLEVHYIEWIAVETTKGAQRKVLKPEEKPIAEFVLTDDDSVVAVYAYCNLHGLWKAE